MAANDTAINIPLRPPPPAGSPELEALLTFAEQKKQALTLNQLQSMFPFKLDGFQMKSVQQLLDGKSVVVCAPTGGLKATLQVGVRNLHVMQWEGGEQL